MKLRISQRHFVHNVETLESFKGIVNRTIDAQQKKPHIDFSINVGYKATAPTEVLDGLTEQMKRLAQKDIKIVAGDLGPGDAWFTAMTDVIGFRSFYNDKEVSEKPKGCVTLFFDADQYDSNRSEVLDVSEIMGKKLLKRDLLLGLSTRDRVSLANTEELDTARKIEEMYHAICMGNIKIENPLDIDLSKSPKCYTEEWGDPIPGFYGINNSCKKFPKWYELLWEDSSRAKLTRLVGLGDTVGVMEASTLVKEIPSIGMPIRGNPPGAFRMESIREKSVELGKTNIGPRYFNTVLDSNNQKKLSKYFLQ